MAAALVVSLVAPASSGTFPGSNAKIAISAEADSQGNENIYSMNPDGTGLTRLSTSASNEQYPSWSADGSKIAFSVDNNGNPGDLGVMNADGSGRTIIYTDSADYIDQVSFSPDGSKIAFATNGSNTPAIQIINADGTGRVTISSASGTSGAVQWSPDGTKVGTVRNVNGNMNIVLINVDGSGETTIPGITTARSVCFSPDGLRITYSSSATNPLTAYVANIDGSGQVPISAASPDNAFFPCFSPDGTKIVYTQSSNVITANADGSGGHTNLGNWPASFSPSWAAGPVAPTTTTVAPTTTTTGGSDPSTPKFTG
jgi:Tol biopolymer transport system component